MASGRNGLAGAHALNSATVVAVMVSGSAPELAQIPRRRLEESNAPDITRKTSIAVTTVLVRAAMLNV